MLLNPLKHCVLIEVFLFIFVFSEILTIKLGLRSKDGSIFILAF